MAKTYDVGCWDLAGKFLQDHPRLMSHEHQHRLAATIQDAIEDYIGFEMATKNAETFERDGIVAMGVNNPGELFHTMKKILGE